MPARKTSTQERRKKRVPFGVPRHTLTVDEETRKKYESEEKVLRWFNDDDRGRIQRALDGGWEFVTDEVKVGDDEEEQEVRIKKRVGRDQYAYLMAILKEWYDEDQLAKEEKNQMVDAAIRGGKPPGLDDHGVAKGSGGSYVKGVDYAP